MTMESPIIWWLKIELSTVCIYTRLTYPYSCLMCQNMSKYLSVSHWNKIIYPSVIGTNLTKSAMCWPRCTLVFTYNFFSIFFFIFFIGFIFLFQIQLPHLSTTSLCLIKRSKQNSILTEKIKQINNVQFFQFNYSIDGIQTVINFD